MSHERRSRAGPGRGLAFFLLLATPAGAYERKKTDLGVPVQWTRQVVTYKMSTAIAAELAEAFPVADVARTVQASFDAWSNQPCSGLQFYFAGITTDTQVGFDRAHPAQNENLVLWSTPDEWNSRHSGDGAVLAFTKTTFDSSTGEILDADIELNDGDFQFTMSDAPDEIVWDVQSTVTHEAGHVVGLADLYENSEETFTMFWNIDPGTTTKRALTADDIDGLCSIYPLEPTLGNPQYNVLFSNPDLRGGCQLGGPGSAGAGAGGMVLGLAFLRALRTGRRRRA